MKTFCANGGRELIFTKLKDFSNKKNIAIKYAAPYMHKENRVVEQRWRIIVMIKNSLLVDIGLPLEF